MTEIKIGERILVSPRQSIERFSLLLWGSPGCGKTTLAATAPGDLLWVNFDPDGLSGLSNRHNIHILDLSPEPNNIVLKFKDADPLGIGRFLAEHPEISTVVVDSITSFGEKALPHGVKVAQSTTKGKSASLEDPGYSGWGNKNTWTRLLVTNMLIMTLKHKRNIIFIAHEDKPTTNDQGHVMFITMMLGSSLSSQVPVQIGETWWLYEKNGKRHIAVRPVQQRKPMKTKMFKVGPKDPSTFEWKFNADTWEGEGINDWYEAWKQAGAKIALPN